MIEKYKVQVQVTRLLIQQTAHGKKSNQVSAIQAQSRSLLLSTWVSKNPGKIIENHKVQVQFASLLIQQNAPGKFQDITLPSKKSLAKVLLDRLPRERQQDFKGDLIRLQWRLRCLNVSQVLISVYFLFFFGFCFAYYKYLHIINIYSLQLTLLNRTREI